MADTAASTNWLDDFLAYSSYGECPSNYLFWVGVGTIAGALRRKVWIDQLTFQWVPNFYVLLVGPPGVKKSTSINMGIELLRQVPDINFGPQIITWPQLITHMADARKTYDVAAALGGKFDASCVTIGISEFGTFFDPLNRELVDNLTDIWDGKLGTIKKETKTMGCDEVVNPWLNIIAGTTPGWVSVNFSQQLVTSGFASRPVYVYADKPARIVPYPSREKEEQDRAELERSLVRRLNEFAALSGPFCMTEEAYRWGEQWYMEYRAWQSELGTGIEQGFYERQQTHLHKLAMVLCVARGGFPTITAADLQEADKQLKRIEPDVRTIFGFVGQSRLSKAASDLVATLRRHSKGSMRKVDLFRRHFFNSLSSDEFEVAVKSATASGWIAAEGPLHDLTLSLREVSDV